MAYYDYGSLESVMLIKHGLAGRVSVFTSAKAFAVLPANLRSDYYILFRFHHSVETITMEVVSLR